MSIEAVGFHLNRAFRLETVINNCDWILETFTDADYARGSMTKKDIEEYREWAKNQLEIEKAILGQNKVEIND